MTVTPANCEGSDMGTHVGRLRAGSQSAVARMLRTCSERIVGAGNMQAQQVLVHVRVARSDRREIGARRLEEARRLDGDHRGGTRLAEKSVSSPMQCHAPRP